jgi:hypothetical protein
MKSAAPRAPRTTHGNHAPSSRWARAAGLLLVGLCFTCNGETPRQSPLPAPANSSGQALDVGPIPRRFAPRLGPPSTWIADWTLLVFAANDDLDAGLIAGFDQDALEWQHGLGGSALFRILVQRDYAPTQLDESGRPRPSERYAIYREEQEDPDTGTPGTVVLGETDTANPATLRDFLVYGVRRFPARHYWVVVTGHGDAWNGLANDVTTGPGARLSIAGLREALGEASRVVASEIRPRDGLNGADTSTRLDVVEFDVCRLGAVEVAASLAGVADYFIASQETVPDAGHPYGALRFVAQDHPGASPRDLVNAVVTDYVRAYVDGVSTAARDYVGTSVTSVGLDLRRMEALDTALRALVQAVRRERPRGFSCSEVRALGADASLRARLQTGAANGAPERAAPASVASVDLIALLEALTDKARSAPSVSGEVREAAAAALSIMGRPHLWTPREPYGVELAYGGQYRRLFGFPPDSPFVIEVHRVDPMTGARPGGLSVLWGDPYDLLRHEGDRTALDVYRALPFEAATGWSGMLEACVAQSEACRRFVPPRGQPDDEGPCASL